MINLPPNSINLLVFTISCIFILFATNYFPSFDELIILGVNDAKSYAIFFTPNYEFSNDFWKIPSHHIDRWPIYLATQQVSLLLPLGWEETSKLLVIIILFVIFYQIFLLNFDLYTKIIISLFIVFSPYTFRYYLFSPYALTDLIFFFSSFLLFVGIKKDNILLTSLGIMLGILSKQTALLFLPIFFIFLILKQINIQRAVYYLALFAVILILKKYIEFQIFGRLISPPNVLHYIGFLQYFNDLEVLFSNAQGLTMSILLLCPLMIFSKYISKKSFLIFLSIFLVFAFQPILAAAGGNIPRLIAFSHPGIIFLFCKTRKPNIMEVLLFLSLMIMTSMHHHFSILHNDKFIFGSIIIISLLISLIYLSYNNSNDE